jgi:hypothetical protein
MEALCPGYGRQWRSRDLFYLWLWREVLVGGELVDDLWRRVIHFMLWIVRRRYLGLLLAEAVAQRGVMRYDSWWRGAHQLSSQRLCIVCRDYIGLGHIACSIPTHLPLVHKLARQSKNRGTLIFGPRTQRLKCIISVDAKAADAKVHRVCNVALTLRDDTIWCAWDIVAGLPLQTTHREMSLMQLS